ncbi:MAG: hypothetical protein WCJ82_01585 [Actinomycetota bacterium]
MSYFENKIIVVFGATGVFGQHVARSLRERGADSSDLADLELLELLCKIADRDTHSRSLRDLAPGSK